MTSLSFISGLSGYGTQGVRDRRRCTIPLVGTHDPLSCVVDVP